MVLQYHPLRNFEKQDNILGFDRIFDLVGSLNQRSSTSDKYPPYNIIKNNTGYVIEVALAGFKQDQIDITLIDNTLKITGELSKETETSDNNSFIYRGISSRKFVREFIVSENINVDRATFNNGLLTVYLNETKSQVKKIPINDSGSIQITEKPQLLNE